MTRGRRRTEAPPSPGPAPNAVFRYFDDEDVLLDLGGIAVGFAADLARMTAGRSWSTWHETSRQRDGRGAGESTANGRVQ
jgi:hypothetical protein